MDLLSRIGLMGPFGLRDVVDVLIVAVIFYQILLRIQGTRAVRIAVGLGVVFVFYLLARLTGLRTVDWLFANVFTYIVLAILVLFQRELRQVLASIGHTPFFRSLSNPVAEEPLDHVISAATAMAQQRRGALIVFERSVGLRNYVAQGIGLDAQISYDLLLSIFHTETPLHDGAVIVQGNRIAAASSFLPLTTNPRLARDLGSRHRAAIGVSEETDAVAVVVSEETGTISIVVDGRITRRVDAASLRVRLRELFHPEPSDDDQSADKQASGTAEASAAAEADAEVAKVGP